MLTLNRPVLLRAPLCQPSQTKPSVAGKLRALFSAGEPLVDAAWHVFQQQRDSDDFQDTLRRILARKGGSLAASPGRGGGASWMRRTIGTPNPAKSRAAALVS